MFFHGESRFAFIELKKAPERNVRSGVGALLGVGELSLPQLGSESCQCGCFLLVGCGCRALLLIFALPVASSHFGSLAFCVECLDHFPRLPGSVGRFLEVAHVAIDHTDELSEALVSFAPQTLQGWVLGCLGNFLHNSGLAAAVGCEGNLRDLQTHSAECRLARLGFRVKHIKPALEQLTQRLLGILCQGVAEVAVELITERRSRVQGTGVPVAILGEVACERNEAFIECSLEHELGKQGLVALEAEALLDSGDQGGGATGDVLGRHGDISSKELTQSNALLQCSAALKI
jgi:hypothetical protein